MRKALAVLLAALALLLSGCAGPLQDVGQQDRRPITVADAASALVAAHDLLEDVGDALEAVHTAAAARARAAAPDDEAKHRAIDEVHAKFKPAWDAYEGAQAVYIAAAAVVRAAQLAELAGRAPDPTAVAAAVLALMSACDALARAAEAVGLPALQKAGNR
jgi:hypothetical protein